MTDALGGDPLDSLRQARETLKDRLPRLNASADHLRNRDRSRIAIAVVYAFLGIVIAIVLYAGLFAAVRPGAWYQIKPATDFALVVLSSVLLPIVTLVLGYYFGVSEAKDR